MNPYTCDEKAITQAELEEALKALAKRWREAPHIVNDGRDADRCGTLIDALKNRFGVSKRIIAVDGQTDFQLV